MGEAFALNGDMDGRGLSDRVGDGGSRAETGAAELVKSAVVVEVVEVELCWRWRLLPLLLGRAGVVIAEQQMDRSYARLWKGRMAE